MLVDNLYGLPDLRACPGTSGSMEPLLFDLEGQELIHLPEEVSMKPGTQQTLNDCLLDKQMDGWMDGRMGGWLDVIT